MDNSAVQRVKQRYGIVGNCEALNRAIEIALKIAPVDLSVLVVARMVWAKSPFLASFTTTVCARTRSTLP